MSTLLADSWEKEIFMSVRDFSFLSGSIFVTFLVSVLSIPILTRLYSPEALGIYGAVTSFCLIMVPLVTFSFEQKIPHEKLEPTAKALFLISVICLLGVSLVVSVVLGLFSFQFRSFEGSAIFFVTPFMVLMGLRSVNIASCIRFGEFDRIAGSRVIYRVCRFGLDACFGVLGMGSSGLLLSDLIATFIQNCKMLPKFTFSREDFSAKFSIKLKEVFRHCFRSSAQLSGAQCLSIASREGPVVFFSFVFGAAVAGQFLIVQKMLRLPLRMVAEPVSQLFWKQASGIIRSGNRELMLRSLVKYTALLGGIGMVMFGCLAIFSDRALPLILGRGWEQSSLLVKWYALFFSGSFIAMPSYFALLVVDREKINLLYEIILSLVVAGTCAFSLFVELSPEGVLAYMSVLGFAVMFIKVMHTFFICM